MTRTSNWHSLKCPQSFVARQITVAEPMPKQVPGGGLHPTSFPLLTVGNEYDTGTQLEPHGAIATILLGHWMIAGAGSVGMTDSVNSHDAKPQLFDAWQVM